jgi:hypothetical protein
MKEHIMNTTTTRGKSVTALLGAAAASASVLLSLGAGISQASDFDPQPEPPGQARGFNPQPEPPTRHIGTFNSQPGLNPPPGSKSVTVGH